MRLALNLLADGEKEPIRRVAKGCHVVFWSTKSRLLPSLIELQERMLKEIAVVSVKNIWVDVSSARQTTRALPTVLRRCHVYDTWTEVFIS